MFTTELIAKLASGSFAGVDLSGIDWHRWLVLALNIFLGVISAISQLVKIILKLIN
jgi:hypothetical protein